MTHTSKTMLSPKPLADLTIPSVTLDLLLGSLNLAKCRNKPIAKLKPFKKLKTIPHPRKKLYIN